MKKYLLFILFFTITSCSSKKSKDIIEYSLGMRYGDFYKLVNKGIENDSIGFKEVIPYYIDNGDTVNGNKHERFVIKFKTEDKEYETWRLEPIFFNDKLLSVKIFNNSIDDLEFAKILLNENLKIDLNKKEDKRYTNNGIDNQEFILELNQHNGIQLLLIEKVLMKERDSIYDLDHKNIMWNEDGDSWTNENQELFKNDLPKERLLKNGK